MYTLQNVKDLIKKCDLRIAVDSIKDRRERNRKRKEITSTIQKDISIEKLDRSRIIVARISESITRRSQRLLTH